MAILHTWNQKLAFHPHLHCIIPGGGTSPDLSRWVAGNPTYLVSVRRLSAVFRGKLLSHLETSYGEGELQGDESALHASLRKAAEKGFVVYAKPPLADPLRWSNTWAAIPIVSESASNASFPRTLIRSVSRRSIEPQAMPVCG